jgi:hypothetical protein
MASSHKLRAVAWWSGAGLSILAAIYALLGITLMVIGRDLDLKDRMEGIGSFCIFLAAGTWGFLVCRKYAMKTPISKF